MGLYDGFDRYDHFEYMEEGLGIDQYKESDPFFYNDLSDTLWEGWFATNEELNEQYGPGMWDREDFRNEFYEFGFDREDISWDQWREMMGY